MRHLHKIKLYQLDHAYRVFNNSLVINISTIIYFYVEEHPHARLSKGPDGRAFVIGNYINNKISN